MAEGQKVRQQASVTAVGRIGSAPEPVGSGKLTKSRLAVNQRVKDKGEWVNGPAMWFDLATGGPQLLGVEKGDLVQVTGRLSMREWEDQGGGKHRDYTIWADEVSNLSTDSDFPVGD